VFARKYMMRGVGGGVGRRCRCPARNLWTGASDEVDCSVIRIAVVEYVSDFLRDNGQEYRAAVASIRTAINFF
jgi:hypothetical protein